MLDWFRQWVGYPERRRGRARLGRLGGEPDGARLRARGAASAPMDDQRRRLHVRPDALVAGARGARARVPPRPGARDPDRPARRACGPTRCAAAIAADLGARAAGRSVVIANAGTTATGAVDPFARAGGDLPRARHLAARRRRLRRLRLPHRARPRGARRASSSPTRSRSTRTSGSTSRSRSARCSCATARRCGAAFEISPDYLEGRRGGRPRGELLGSRPAAHPHLPRAQALDLAPLLRPGRVPRRRSTAASTSRCTRRRGSSRRRELELMSPASLGIVTFRRHPAGVDDEAVLERINAEPGRRRSSASGEVFVSTGRVRGRYVLRLCILNHSTSQRRGRPRARAGGVAAGRAGGPPRRPRARELPADSRRAGCGGRRSTRTRCARCRCSPRSTTSQRRACCDGAHEHHALRRGADRRAVAGRRRDLYVVLERRRRGRRRRRTTLHALGPGRVLRRARGDRLGRRLRPHPHGHGDGDASRRGCSCSTGRS